MKTMRCFDFRRQLPDRAEIQDGWIERTVRDPVKTEVQSDARIRKWAKIEEAGGRCLRVVLLADGVTLHKAFFDRGFRG